jgi:hypothetical protein
MPTPIVLAPRSPTPPPVAVLDTGCPLLAGHKEGGDQYSAGSHPSATYIARRLLEELPARFAQTLSLL